MHAMIYCVMDTVSFHIDDCILCAFIETELEDGYLVFLLEVF
jgi:hypothetical protein